MDIYINVILQIPKTKHKRKTNVLNCNVIFVQNHVLRLEVGQGFVSDYKVGIAVV